MRFLHASAPFLFRQTLLPTFKATAFTPRPHQQRCIHIPPVLLPPVIFTGLLGALWLWKCMMMVVFQNKIIYMPGMPPNSRRETVADYASHCWGIRWREGRMRSTDGTDLAIAVAHVLQGEKSDSKVPTAESGRQTPKGHVYILYFQGNASSIPPRLPDLSYVLRAVAKNKERQLASVRFTMVCLSYRGYWTSRGRASERGIKLDAEAALRWISNFHAEEYVNCDKVPQLVVLLWGQSIGSGVATNLVVSSLVRPGLPRINGMMLETPFLSVRDMLAALYPQKWLPYRHLWPFLRNHLDSWENLGSIAKLSRNAGRATPDILLLEAGRDEIVPAEHGEKLLQRCLDVGLPARKETVPRAYHNESMIRTEGRQAAAAFILEQAKRHVGRGVC